MNFREKVECLRRLTEIQQKTAPIVVSIGDTEKDNMVTRNTLVLKECPPLVIEKLAEEGYMMGVYDGGVSIEMAPHEGGK